MMTWKEIKDEVREWEYMPSNPDCHEFTRYGSDYIVDEAKSVAWNRQERERLQEPYLEEKERLQSLKDDKEFEIRKHVVDLIAEDCDIPENAAEIILDYMYDDGVVFATAVDWTKDFVDEFVRPFTTELRKDNNVTVKIGDRTI